MFVATVTTTMRQPFQEGTVVPEIIAKNHVILFSDCKLILVNIIGLSEQLVDHSIEEIFK